MVARPLWTQTTFQLCSMRQNHANWAQGWKLGQRVMTKPEANRWRETRHMLPPMNSLRAFETAARLGSMTRAARELGVTQGAVSRQVANLERFLEIELFRRDHRGITLTAHGEAYFAILRELFSRLNAGHSCFMQTLEHNVLKVMLPPTFAMRWFVPRLHRLHAQYPDLSVQITTSHQLVDFSVDDADVAIWSTEDTVKDIGMVPLFGEVLVPVCSPRLLEEGPPLRKPSDLRRHVLLYSLQRPEDWQQWLTAFNIGDVGEESSIGFEHSGLAYQAAIDSAGVAIAQTRLAQNDIDAGRLVAPFNLPARSERTYYLVTPHGRVASRKIQSFARWLKSEAANETLF